MTEIVEPIQFPELPQSLLDMLEFLEEARWQLAHVCQFEFYREELNTFNELTHKQVDRLLTSGRL